MYKAFQIELNASIDCIDYYVCKSYCKAFTTKVLDLITNWFSWSVALQFHPTLYAVSPWHFAAILPLKVSFHFFVEQDVDSIHFEKVEKISIVAGKAGETRKEGWRDLPKGWRPEAFSRPSWKGVVLSRTILPRDTSVL